MMSEEEFRQGDKTDAQERHIIETPNDDGTVSLSDFKYVKELYKHYYEAARHSASERLGLQTENHKLRQEIADLKRKVKSLEPPEGTLSKPKQAALCDAELAKMGIKNRLIFRYNSLNEILEAIREKKLIGKNNEINIWEKTNDPTFRFYTMDEPALSLQMSHILAEKAKFLRIPSEEFSEIGRKKRSEHADDYARKMHDRISQTLSEKPFKSFREAAKTLTAKEIPTPLKGEWHAATLTTLNKRWEKLGLSPLIPKSK